MVRQVHFCPQTTHVEKRKLFYSSQNFDVFYKEEVYEQIGDKIACFGA